MTGLGIIEVNDALLAEWPLPQPSAEGDKEERGRILLAGGSPEMPGAIILAANAALRAGAGKLTVATAQGVAQLVAAQIPEARVIALDQDRDGDLVAGALQNALGPIAKQFDAVVMGPGFDCSQHLLEDIAAIVPKFIHAKVVLDACAMEAIKLMDDVRRCGMANNWPPIALTPHAGEMAHLTGEAKQTVLDRSQEVLHYVVRHWQAIVALKGACTLIGHPDGTTWEHRGGNSGLAISGSGDTLAGIIGGLASRGCTLEQACVWGVVLHARAGEVLADQLGPLGYLPREIADQVPRLMHQLGSQ